MERVRTEVVVVIVVVVVRELLFLVSSVVCGWIRGRTGYKNSIPFSLRFSSAARFLQERIRSSVSMLLSRNLKCIGILYSLAP